MVVKFGKDLLDKEKSFFIFGNRVDKMQLNILVFVWLKLF